MGKKKKNKKKKPRGGQREYQGYVGGTVWPASPTKGIISGGVDLQSVSSFLSEAAVSRFDYPKITHQDVIGGHIGSVYGGNDEIVDGHEVVASTTEVADGLGSGGVS